jgi:hypothetical protein
MRIRTITGPTVAIISAFALAGCDAPTPEQTRNCPIEAHSPSNSFQLTYRLTSPEPCPSTLSQRAQLKEAAARIVDGGGLDVVQASVEVTNRVGSPVGYMIVNFGRQSSSGAWVATPSVAYRAGTALAPPPQLNTPDQINREFDFGRFETWADGPGRPGNPYGTVRITYRQSAMYANVIAGTRIPLAGATSTWTAGATGGVRPYRFQWYRDGTPVGTDSAYTAAAGASDFELRAEITDAGGNTRTAATLIDVDGVRAAAAGPSAVYAAGGSWSASGEGGYPPYTFDWYALDQDLAEQWVGSGAVWEGYPGDGQQQLRVRMTDSRGTTDNALLRVHGLGGGSESCQPVPPQITCS